MKESRCILSLKMNSKESFVKKSYTMIPPDGGWGYMIALAATINLSVGCVFPSCFGLLYKDFMQEHNMSSTHVTTMMGIGAVCSATTGFLTNILLTRISIRILVFIAVLLLNAGAIGNIFANSIFTFYICVGILPSTGMGVIFNTSFTLLNQYFDKNRMRVISCCQTVIALLTMVVPMFLKWSLNQYGYRGTLLLIAAISMNNLIAVALIQPVEKHMKKVEIQDTEEDEILITKKEMQNKLEKLEDIENCGDKEESNSKNIKGYIKILDALFDKSLRKNYLRSCVCYGPAVCMFSDLTYGTILPQALYANAWSQDNVALALSLMAFGDLTMRIAFIFISNWLLKFGSAEIYLSGIIIALITRLGALWTKSVIANMIFFTLTGIARCSIAILIPVVISDAVLPEQFTSALGINMMISGAVSLLLGLAIGAVRDLTGSYGAAFYLIISCFAIIALLWIIELCYKKCQQKRQQRREYLQQSQNNKN